MSHQKRTPARGRCRGSERAAVDGGILSGRLNHQKQQEVNEGSRSRECRDRGGDVFRRSSRRPRAGSDYLCSLGTKTVLGNSTNGLFGVLPDDGPENWSLNPPGSPPGRPKVAPPDWPFDILSESWSGSGWRSNVITGLTGYVVNAEAACAPDRKATTPTMTTSGLLIGTPLDDMIVDLHLTTFVNR